MVPTTLLRGGIALVVALAALTAGVAGVPLQGDATGGDDVKRIGNVDLAVTDEAVTVSGVHVEGEPLPDVTIEERTYAIDEATVAVDGIAITYDGTTYEISGVTLRVEDVSVTLEDVVLGDG